MSLISVAVGITFFLVHSLTPIEDQQDLMQLLQRPPIFKESQSLQEVL